MSQMTQTGRSPCIFWLVVNATESDGRCLISYDAMRQVVGIHISLSCCVSSIIHFMPGTLGHWDSMLIVTVELLRTLWRIKLVSQANPDGRSQLGQYGAKSTMMEWYSKSETDRT